MTFTNLHCEEPVFRLPTEPVERVEVPQAAAAAVEGQQQRREEAVHHCLCQGQCDQHRVVPVRVGRVVRG